jgi:hypothetical protein
LQLDRVGCVPGLDERHAYSVGVWQKNGELTAIVGKHTGLSYKTADDTDNDTDARERNVGGRHNDPAQRTCAWGAKGAWSARRLPALSERQRVEGLRQCWRRQQGNQRDEA